MRHGTHVWLYCGQKGTDPNAISSNLPLTVLCQWNTKTVPWNSNPWNSKVEYDNRGIARVLFHGFGAIPRVLVSSVWTGAGVYDCLYYSFDTEVRYPCGETRCRRTGLRVARGCRRGWRTWRRDLFVFVKKHTRGGESRKEGGDTEESRK